jgi:hypothetical protein
MGGGGGGGGGPDMMFDEKLRQVGGFGLDGVVAMERTCKGRSERLILSDT